MLKLRFCDSWYRNPAIRKPIALTGENKQTEDTHRRKSDRGGVMRGDRATKGRETYAG